MTVYHYGESRAVVSFLTLAFVLRAADAQAQTDNTATGTSALSSNTTGDYNTATGAKALRDNDIGFSNTATGRGALYKNTSGFENTATGASALYWNVGFQNTATGASALENTTDGDRNTAVGVYALYDNDDGSWNTAVGYGAMSATVNGLGNVALGYLALGDNTGGSANTAIGYEALDGSSTGSFNTAVGDSSMKGIGDLGDYNTAIGYGAGPASGYSNSGAFGNGAIATASNTIRIGNTAITSIGGQVAWSSLSDARFKKNVHTNVPGLDFIRQLRPVTYSWDVDKLESTGGARGEGEKERRARAAKVHTGFLAQEVEAAATRCGYDFDGVVKPANAESRYELQYSQFVVPLVRAVQEQQEEIEGLRAAVQRLSTGRHHSAALLGNVSTLAAAVLGALLAAALWFKRTTRA